jgi:hypothetical protein
MRLVERGGFNVSLPVSRLLSRSFFAAFAVFCGFGTFGASAGEIHILAAVAVQDPLERLTAAFAQATGNKIEIRYGLTGPILADIKAGKSVDAVVLPEAGRKSLEDAGLLLSDIPVAASLAGVGVRAKEPLPDVSSLESSPRCCERFPRYPIPTQRAAVRSGRASIARLSNSDLPTMFAARRCWYPEAARLWRQWHAAKPRLRSLSKARSSQRRV